LRLVGLPITNHRSPITNPHYLTRSIFRTLQGEGAWAGRPAVFVRLAACNMWTGEEVDRERDAGRSGAACPLWCDTDFRAARSVKLTAEELVEEVLVASGGPEPKACPERSRRASSPEPKGIRYVVLTGGEPLLQADAELVAALRAAGFFVACETNGTIALADAFGSVEAGPDWVVCSPKLPVERLVIEAMDELKLIVPDYQPADYARLAGRVRPHRLAGGDVRYLWLQPEDGPRLEQASRLAVDLALADPRWRVSVQGHKVLGVD
jgi:organic radical activating enzyme